MIVIWTRRATVREPGIVRHGTHRAPYLLAAGAAKDRCMAAVADRRAAAILLLILPALPMIASFLHRLNGVPQ
jgi:hypothetical protein